MAEPSVPSQRHHPSASTGTICPYLLADGGAWRASTATRAHRCAAVTPPALLAIDKQRRLCLTSEHDGCATFVAARALRVVEGPRPASSAPERPTARLVARTTPLVLDHGRLALSTPTFGLRLDRSMGQAALVLLMVLAFAAILVARLTTADGTGAAGVAGATGTPAPSAIVGGGPPAASPDGPASGEPRGEEPTDLPTSRPGVVDPTDAPARSGEPGSYVVRSGDTLSGIAAEFGTTWQELARLNDIDDAGRLRIGQELRLP